MNSQSTLIGLLLGVSLAAGYVTGRLHADLSENDLQPESLTALEREAGHTELALQGEVDLRSRLNPSPVAETATEGIEGRETQSFGRYARPVRATKPGIPNLQEGPRHIGEFRDPDVLYESDGGPPRHIGSFVDPDDPWPNNPSGGRVNIGEFSDPDVDL